MFLSPTLLAAFLGGIVPALLWLAFWLFEDRCEPEPKTYLFFTFILGGLMVAPVLFIEEYAMGLWAGTSLLVAWALTEELAKLLAALLGGLLWSVFDEPLDALVYMVTAALGFASVENSLFIFGALGHGTALQAAVTGDLRFIGATLLHTLSSAVIGVALALAYFKSVGVRRLAALAGVILAVALHTLFNFLILGQGGGATFWVFLFIWFGIIVILLMAERVKIPARDYC
jgi:RsiW-degrading membrane proteinase PrsW (M82 family)